MNSLSRTLGTEEPDIFTVAVRPGVVDTDMQTLIRSSAQPHMSAKDFAYFEKLHEDKVLLAPEE